MNRKLPPITDWSQYPQITEASELATFETFGYYAKDFNISVKNPIYKQCIECKLLIKTTRDNIVRCKSLYCRNCAAFNHHQNNRLKKIEPLIGNIYPGTSLKFISSSNKSVGYQKYLHLFIKVECVIHPTIKPYDVAWNHIQRGATTGCHECWKDKSKTIALKNSLSLKLKLLPGVKYCAKNEDYWLETIREIQNDKPQQYWECLCCCGKIFIIAAASIMRKNGLGSRSCGCYQKFNQTHNMWSENITHFENNNFRSSQEVALWLFAKNQNKILLHEPKTFELKINGQIIKYTPDFYFPELNLWVELKDSKNRPRNPESIVKFEAFAKEQGVNAKIYYATDIENECLNTTMRDFAKTLYKGTSYNELQKRHVYLDNEPEKLQTLMTCLK